MRASAKDKELHDKIVLAQIRAYRKEGAKVIAADLEGWTLPPSINGHVPDIMVEYQGRMVYNEVETCETIQSPETREQLQTLSCWAGLHVTVPKCCKQKAKVLMTIWGINVGQVWTYDDM